jgi:hypothetical protein
MFFIYQFINKFKFTRCELEGPYVQFSFSLPLEKNVNVNREMFPKFHVVIWMCRCCFYHLPYIVGTMYSFLEASPYYAICFRGLL